MYHTYYFHIYLFKIHVFVCDEDDEGIDAASAVARNDQGPSGQSVINTRDISIKKVTLRSQVRLATVDNFQGGWVGLIFSLLQDTLLWVILVPLYLESRHAVHRVVLPLSELKCQVVNNSCIVYVGVY